MAAGRREQEKRATAGRTFPHQPSADALDRAVIGPAGLVLACSDREGTGTGQGLVRGTVMSVGSRKGGTFGAIHAIQLAFLDDGQTPGATSAGGHEAAGKPGWNTRTILHVCDGTILHS